MIKIAKSLAMIALVGAVALGITGAYFSDTETSRDNVMQAGSLDLTVNSKDDPNVEAVVSIYDMKPCIVRYSAPITLEVTNNRGKLYKHIVLDDPDDVVCTTGDLTEPECTEQGGIWTGADCDWVRTDLTSGECASMGGTWDDPNCTFTDKNYLPTDIWFDLAVWRGSDAPPTETDDDGTDPICDDSISHLTTNCWETLIPDGVITVEQIASKMIYLGEYGTDLAVNKITIRQSFHLKPEVTNWAQGDKCEFTEEFFVRQINAGHQASDDVCIPTDGGCQSCTSTEGAAGSGECSDGIDNDCDGFTDGDDPDCQ